MRYVGQGHEIVVELPPLALQASDWQALREAERDYAVLFERHIPNRHRDPELVGPGLDRGQAAGKQGAAPAVPQPVPVGKRPVFDGRSGRTTEVPVYRREAAARQCLPGAGDRRRGRDLDLYFGQFCRAYRCLRLYRHGPQGRVKAHGQSNSVGLIDLQIMWNRLIAVVEEQAQTLMRTAFGPIVRECGDLSAGVFDLEGRMLAQAVTGTPGHVNSMAESVKHFLRYRSRR